MEEFSFKVELTFLSGDCDPDSRPHTTDTLSSGSVLGLVATLWLIGGELKAFLYVDALAAVGSDSAR